MNAQMRISVWSRSPSPNVSSYLESAASHRSRRLVTSAMFFAWSGCMTFFSSFLLSCGVTRSFSRANFCHALSPLSLAFLTMSYATLSVRSRKVVANCLE